MRSRSGRSGADRTPRSLPQEVPLAGGILRWDEPTEWPITYTDGLVSDRKSGADCEHGGV